MEDNKLKLDQMKILVTSECNLNCTHCFRSADKHKYFISNAKLIELADFAIETSCDSISFSGGEYFMHPFAYELLDYCFSKKLRVKILTNATMIHKIEYFEKYKGTDLMSFQISLDGMKKNHDLRRGKGVFDLVISNVEKLRAFGIHTTASMTINQDNMFDVIDVLNLSCFDDFNFLPVAFAGEEARHGRPHMNDKYKEYEEIIRAIYKSNNSVLGEDYRCRMFPHQLGIKYDGTVYPCAVARDYGIFYMGNLNERPIKDIVYDYLKSEKSKELLEYKCNNIPECNECSQKDVCSRGCRARAYKFFGKLLAPDPFCCKLFDKDFSDIPINCVFWGEK